jgi:uncharacterized protein YndB with AHSA1/START domain
MSRKPLDQVLMILIVCSVVGHFALAADGAAPPSEAMDVQAKVSGGEVVVEAQAFIDAPPREVWSVFTDYDHMTRFVSSLEKSRILERKGETLLVSQQGRNQLGPFSTTFESLREVELTPYRLMHSRGVGGNVEDYEAITRFVPEGSGTRILHHVQFVPALWVPPIIGPALIERETRIHFEELFKEIARRREIERSEVGG